MDGNENIPFLLQAAGLNASLATKNLDGSARGHGVTACLAFDDFALALRSVHAQGELQYGDQIIAVDGKPLVGLSVHDVIAPSPTHTFRVRRTPGGSPAKKFAVSAPIA